MKLKKSVLIVLRDSKENKYLVDEDLFIEVELEDGKDLVEVAKDKLKELGYDSVSLVNEAFKYNYHYSTDDSSYSLEVSPLMFELSLLQLGWNMRFWRKCRPDGPAFR